MALQFKLDATVFLQPQRKSCAAGRRRETVRTSAGLGVIGGAPSAKLEFRPSRSVRPHASAPPARADPLCLLRGADDDRQDKDSIAVTAVAPNGDCGCVLIT